MAKTRNRIILLLCSLLAIAVLYWLPKSVVENESQLKGEAPLESKGNPHSQAPAELRKDINRLRARHLSGPSKEKNAIFADSLAILYKDAGLFDSAAWFAEESNTFFNTNESLTKAGNAYYEAYTFAVDKAKQTVLAEKTRILLGQILKDNPDNLEVKTKIAMTYLSSSSPMQGIKMLREVLATDPENETALFNMGMLSIQSGQYGKATEWLQKLIAVDSSHIQGQLLLGVAYLNQGEKTKAKTQFEKVKKMDKDPSVQSTVDSYLEELK